MKRFQKIGFLSHKYVGLNSSSTTPKGELRQITSLSILGVGFSTVKWKPQHLFLEVQSKGNDMHMNKNIGGLPQIC